MPRPSPRRPPRSLFLGLSLALGLCQPLPVLAQTPDPSPSASAPADPTTVARTRFSEALALARKSRWTEAYPLFLEAWQNKQHWQIALNLGQAEIKIEKLRDAAQHLLFVETAPDAPDADRRQAAELRSTAQARLGHLHIEASPHGARVLVDGTFVGKAPLMSAVDVDPGLHVIELRLGQGQIEESTVIKAGETASVTIALPLVDIEPASPLSLPNASALDTSPTPRATSSTPPLLPERGATPIGGVVALGGLALAGAAVGIGLFTLSAQRGAQADNLVSAVKDPPGLEPKCQLPACTAADELLGEQDFFENAAVGTWIGAGIAGAAAVGLWLLTRRPPATPSAAAAPHRSRAPLVSSPTLDITITGQSAGFVVQGQF